MTTYKLLIINPVKFKTESLISATKNVPLGIVYGDTNFYELVDTGIEVKKYGWLRRMLRKLI